MCVKYKAEYLKFVTLIALKKRTYHTQKCINSIMLSDDKIDMPRLEKFKNEMNQLKLLCKNLFNISTQEDVDTMIYEMWPSIFELLKLGKIKYNQKINDTLFFEENDDLYDWQYRIVELKLDEKFNNIPPFYVDIMNLIRSGDNSLLGIYMDIIDSKLYNPNELYSSNSGEPFWTVLPDPIINNKLELIDLNRKVLLDKRTNYYLLSNGDDKIEGKLFSCTLDNPYSIKQAKINIDEVTDIIIKNKFSVLDSYREEKNYNLDNARLIEYIFNAKYKNEFYKEIKNLRDYLLSNNGIEDQLINSKYPTLGRNNNIEFYNALIKQNSDEQINKLLSLKK